MRLSIDTSRLENIRTTSGKITARCPACATMEGDRGGIHLFINAETGQFGCVKFPGDREHRCEIFRLVGIRRDPDAERQWRKQRAKQQSDKHARHKVSAVLRAKRSFIVAQYPWSSSEASAESLEKRPEWLHDPRCFLTALFPPDAVVWTGETHHSGQGGRHADHWKPVTAWQNAPKHTVGPMTCPAIWSPGTVSRSSNNVLSAPFTVLDFDGFDGKPPGTSREIVDHLRASMALVRWLREALGWQLAALLHTGNKSLHAWFHRPSPEALSSLFHSAEALGVDAGLIEHPEHPCRLPGMHHEKTGNLSRVLWLQSPKRNS